jgi:chromosome segregation protein
MALLLKQLDIHGFKSFASPTTFAFDRGITAVIGPNGSGKSNVAEALRWVLGEQGHANLRSRRTEDVIFAGSDKRAPLGLAEVTLTLDNSDGDLPLPYTDITVTRRAFRSGENQYLINGSRVRLKDVQQLVAPLGQSYTIIGQGLVDAALSQRPEERRGLFEHAAGISGLRLRANDAERSLQETAANAQRLRDILSELEPRVRLLERQARLAREYSSVRDRLHALQRLHFAHLWGASLARESEARAALQQVDATLAARETDQASVLKHLSETRARQRRVNDALSSVTDELAARERELAAERHQLELLDTRARSNGERLADLRGALADLERERAELDAERAHLEAAQQELGLALQVLQARLADHDAKQAAARAAQAERHSELQRAEQAALDRTRDIATTEGQLAALQDRRTTTDTEEAEATLAVQRATEQRDELDDERSCLQSRIADAEATAMTIAQQLQAQERALADARQATQARRDELEAVEREHAALRARREALDRTHASGEGLNAGVRAVLRAVRRGELELPGFVGTVAETLRVPPRFETAIEVALGGHLQDVIVARWDEARTAIDFLKRSNAGRATFQPLDTVRPGRRPALRVRDGNLLGVAADLVSAPDAVAPVTEQLLGRTLLVSDLVATQCLLPQAPGWTVVTLAGEITRPSGSVTGGGRAAEAGLLARERERRTLPATLARVQERMEAIRAGVAASTASANDLASDIERLRASLTQQQHLVQTHKASLTRVDHELVTVTSRVDAGQTRLTALHDRRSQLAAEEQRLRDRLETIERERAEQHALAEQLREEVATLHAAATEAPATLRAELATTTERLRSTERRLHQVCERQAAIARTVTIRETERARLAEQDTAATAARAAHNAALERLASAVRQLEGRLPPLQADRATCEQALTDAERAVDRATERVREAERDRDRAALALARVQDEQAFLGERIRSDLALDDPAALLALDLADERQPDEQEITRLRERLRRMSVVSDDVLEQYEAESQRLAFLSQQLADVDEATAGLRRVLGELNTQMATRFSTTFQEVARGFEHTFGRLFGGGAARLVLDESNDHAGGIDIVAQPPGKRLQSLNALSGGERALTAVALLIAIQRVNPSPFCLLDEVDAALDESNVLRFRDEVRDLAQTTQFVIITHNRGTIEGADTLYGVTMGGDGVSRVLSLRLEEAVRAVEEYEVLEVTGS